MRSENKLRKPFTKFAKNTTIMLQPKIEDTQLKMQLVHLTWGKNKQTKFDILTSKCRIQIIPLAFPKKKRKKVFIVKSGSEKMSNLSHIFKNHE